MGEFKTIDDYISSFSGPVKEHLQKLHLAIKEEAPDATEAISYAMPTFKLNGNLVHFAGYKNHIGLYPTPSGIRAFQKEFVGYKWSKGSVQFPIDQPIPLDLVRRIVQFRVKENLEKRK